MTNVTWHSEIERLKIKQDYLPQQKNRIRFLFKTSVNDSNGSALQFVSLNWPSEDFKGNDLLFLE